jgi:hypothetical protein
MLTKADKKFLKANFATKGDLKSFATKDDLKEQLRDQKEQILDAVDGKLVHQKEAIVKEVGEYIADTIVPMFEKRDTQVARIEKKIDLPPFAD